MRWRLGRGVPGKDLTSKVDWQEAQHFQPAALAVLARGVFAVPSLQRVATAHCIHPACGQLCRLQRPSRVGLWGWTFLLESCSLPFLGRLTIAGQERAAASEQGGEHGIRASGKAVLTETSIGPGCCLLRSSGAGAAGKPRLSLFA